jgi:GPH family glycoside/pentoside/hexuronide:cation symporter
MTISGDDRHATAASDRVPWPQLVAYGMGGLIPIALFNIAGQLISLIGNISLGLSAISLGTVMLVARLWDAISDPIIGHISDNTRTRWGRRRPYILIGGIATAVSFVAMWWVPRGEWIQEVFPSDAAYNWFQLGYILVGLLVFFTACTVFEIPHGALGMEMSTDYHERTRLFSAKSFCGNLFAMGTPWLILLAGLECFRGPGGDLADGMRYVSIVVAALLVPLVYWWFVALREPGFAIVKQQEKSAFWDDMRLAMSNTTFLSLVVIIFTLAMGFNFVSLFNYYITIFYLYGGDPVAAGPLLGINGSVWAITALVAVFPLNWLSRRIGKSRTLLIAILLMCCAQLAKIVCYDPQHPYLVVLPTILLSAGMLMFFTLGASMVGDVCDEDELRRSKRSEGTYYSVYWWFIKLGTAFASFVTGALLVFTSFDEKQNVTAEACRADVAIIQTAVERWQVEDLSGETRVAECRTELARVLDNAREFEAHLAERDQTHPFGEAHRQHLASQLRALRAAITAFQDAAADPATPVEELQSAADDLLLQTTTLKRQTPQTLFRLRAVEIGLPLLLSVVSIFLTLRYPLTEARCYEIKEALQQRRAKLNR